MPWAIAGHSYPSAGPPQPPQVASRRVELQHRRAAVGTVQNPDVVVAVDRHRGDLAHAHAVGNGRPARVDLEAGRLPGAAVLGDRRPLDGALAQGQRDQERQQRQRDEKSAAGFHAHLARMVAISLPARRRGAYGFSPRRPAACGESPTAFDRRCITAGLRCSSLTYAGICSLLAPCQPRASPVSVRRGVSPPAATMRSGRTVRLPGGCC